MSRSQTATPRPAPLFVADDPALDFLNTHATPGGLATEWIGGGADFLDWLHAARLWPEGQRTPEPATLDRAASQAVALRTWFGTFVRRHAGHSLGEVAPGELAALNDVLSAGRLVRHLDRAAGGGLSWNVVQHWETASDLVQPIARMIGDLLCTADFAHIRQCQGAGCSLWFLDVSKSHQRRWCSMATCGNRAKAAQHRARLRGA